MPKYQNLSAENNAKMLVFLAGVLFVTLMSDSINLLYCFFSAKTIGVRMLGKVLQLCKMLVPDQKHGPQMSRFSPTGQNMTAY